MEDFSLDRFGQLLQNLKDQKQQDQDEGDERAVAFNEGSNSAMMDNMM